MAFEFSNYSVKITRVASGDLSASQYRFVKLSTTDLVVVCSSATDIPIGVLQNAPTSGQEAEILIIGGTKVEAGEALAIGDALGIVANGRGAAANTTTEYTLGTVLSTTAAAGEYATAVINCANPVIRN
jgi:hypothetical protein